MQNEIITLDELKSKFDNNLVYQAYIQAIIDAWENWAYEKRQMQDDEVGAVDITDVEYFKKYCETSNTYYMTAFLPDSATEWQKIIKFAEENTFGF